MTVELTAEGVIAINAEVGGQGAGVRDRGGIDGAIGRAYATFMGTDAWPSAWEKAASLVHSFATTQYFFDGNKRTAFVAALTFLELNGYYLGEIEPVVSEVLTLGVAAGSIEVQQIAEWLEVMHERRRRGAASDPRFEYLFIAEQADLEMGTLSALHAGWAGGQVPDGGFPSEGGVIPFVVCARIHWREDDFGSPHRIRIRVVPRDESRTKIPLFNEREETIEYVGRGGHEHQPGGLLPHIITMQLSPAFYDLGQYVVEVFLDDTAAGEIHIGFA
jgi:death-on-curing family protein